MYRLSKRSYERLNGVDAILIAILTESIKDSPYDFGIPRSGGMRTAEEQNVLYKKGRSRADGFRHKSYHQTGKAFDIYAFVDGEPSWDKEYLRAIARHIMDVADDMFNVDLEWGGTWHSFKDYPHFQTS